jgi:hypothetical protein
MSDHDAGEYDLADLPEEKPAPPPRPPVVPGKPLPRLWKTEQEGGDDSRGGASDRKEASAPAARRSARSSDPRGAASPSRAPASASSDEGPRKVLLEDTPALDTFEGRQRARFVLGGLIAACFGIFGWIFYQVFLYDPVASDYNPDEPPVVTLPPPPPRKDLDSEAQAMFRRAQERAKDGNTKEALNLLENIVKVYKGTKTATQAREALDRPKANLPLFLDRPAVQATVAPRPQPAPQPPPPQVVQREAPSTQGNATLTLPANPPELTPSRPSPLAMAKPSVAPSPTTVRPLPRGFRARVEAGVHGTGWPLVIVGDRDGAPMVFVPGGVFEMGRDGGPRSEAPAHKVRLSPYYIDQHEVTVHQFKLFLSETHYRGQPVHGWTEDMKHMGPDSTPMVMVNARDAQAYSDWSLKQMPTEAQWELAARSTDSRLYPWGNEPIPAAQLAEFRKSGPAQEFPNDVSPYGVKDMAGGVFEWTHDWYDPDYYHQFFGQPALDPAGPASRPRSLELVVKGDRKAGIAATRQGIMLEKRLNYVGFRCVLPVVETPSPINASPAAPAAGPLPAPVPAPGQPPANVPPPQAPSAPTVPF